MSSASSLESEIDKRELAKSLEETPCDVRLSMHEERCAEIGRDERELGPVEGDSEEEEEPGDRRDTTLIISGAA